MKWLATSLLAFVVACESDPAGSVPTPHEDASVDTSIDADVGVDSESADVTDLDSADSDVLTPDASDADSEPGPDLAADVALEDAADAVTAGSGLGYSGEEEAGVNCDDEVCNDGLACCSGIVNPGGCFTSGSNMCTGIDFACDGPEDCPGDSVCCVSGEISLSRAGRSSCVVASECAGEATRAACNDDDDCEDGACIRGFTAQLMLDVGWCQDGPASDCEIVPDSECRGDDLTGAELSGLDGTRGDFSGVNLTDTLMRDFVAVDATFDEANLTRTVLSSTRVSGASFANTTLDNTNFRKSDLSAANFAGARGDRTNFTECTLDGAIFSAVVLDRGSFSLSSAVEANFDGADLTSARFADMDLTGASFDRALVDGTTWSRVTCPDGTFVDLTESCDGHWVP